MCFVFDCGVVLSCAQMSMFMCLWELVCGCDGVLGCSLFWHYICKHSVVVAQLTKFESLVVNYAFQHR